MQYRRAKHKGGRYFFTVNLAERNRSLLIDHLNELRACMKKVQQKHPYFVEAIVILPDHLHAIWTLPIGDDDYATRWMFIKSNFSRVLPENERINSSRLNKRERGVYPKGTSGNGDIGSIGFVTIGDIQAFIDSYKRAF